jgi:hypothetical protein
MVTFPKVAQEGRSASSPRRAPRNQPVITPPPFRTVTVWRNERNAVCHSNGTFEWAYHKCDARSTVPVFEVAMSILCSFGDSRGFRRRLKRDGSIGLLRLAKQLAFFSNPRTGMVGGTCLFVSCVDSHKRAKFYPYV